MRCPDCNKFVSYDDSTEPEIDVDIDDKGNVTGNVRIVLTCQECGMELKEATFDIDMDFSDAFDDPADEWDVEATGELECRVQTSMEKRLKSGKVKVVRFKPRYYKTFYGARLGVTVTNGEGGGKREVEREWYDEVQASGMDELT